MFILTALQLCEGKCTCSLILWQRMSTEAKGKRSTMCWSCSAASHYLFWHYWKMIVQIQPHNYIWQEMHTHLFSESAGAFSSPSGVVSGAAVGSASLGTKTRGHLVNRDCLTQFGMWEISYWQRIQRHHVYKSPRKIIIFQDEHSGAFRWNTLSNYKQHLSKQVDKCRNTYI